jgi:hypothetical protein
MDLKTKLTELINAGNLKQGQRDFEHGLLVNGVQINDCVVLIHSKTRHPPSLKTTSPCAAGKNFLDCCTKQHQNLIITDILSLMLKISGSNPSKAPEISALSTHTPNKIHKLQGNPNSCNIKMMAPVNKSEQVTEPSLLHVHLCHPYQFPELLLYCGVCLQFTQQWLLNNLHLESCTDHPHLETR